MGGEAGEGEGLHFCFLAPDPLPTLILLFSLDFIPTPKPLSHISLQTMLHL